MGKKCKDDEVIQPHPIKEIGTHLGNESKIVIVFFYFFQSKSLIPQVSINKEEEAWRRGCDAGSHTHGRGFGPHRGIYLYVFRFL